MNLIYFIFLVQFSIQILELWERVLTVNKDAWNIDLYFKSFLEVGIDLLSFYVTLKCSFSLTKQSVVPFSENYQDMVKEP